MNWISNNKTLMKKLFISALCIGGTAHLEAATFTVSNSANTGAGSLRKAMTDAELSADPSNEIVWSGGAGTIMLEEPLPPITKDLTIDAGLLAVTIDGSSMAMTPTTRPFTVTGGLVSISNLTLDGCKATGGSGSFGGTGTMGGGGGGGGGAGLGGAVYVGEAADVTLVNITFVRNTAEGGAGGSGRLIAMEWGGGGGGGLGGPASSPSAMNDGGNGGDILPDFPPFAGGGGSGATGGVAATPNPALDFEGGGGGGRNMTNMVDTGSGAAGGYGAGGGGGADNDMGMAGMATAFGGAGGFGGGGGGGGFPVVLPGSSGGAGNSSGRGGDGPGGGGGGGSAFGGHVFVRHGGKLTMTDCDLSGGSTTAGAPGLSGALAVGTPPSGGLAGGVGMYLSSDVPTTLNGTDNTTTTIAEEISGPGGITKSGGGKVILTGTNDYTGGTTITAGTLQGDTDSLKGSIQNNATIVFDQAAMGTFEGIGAIPPSLAGTGDLVKRGDGRLNIDNQNEYSGTTTVENATLRLLTTPDAIYKSSSVEVQTNGTLLVDANNTLNNLHGDGNIIINADVTAVIDPMTTQTIDGNITETGTGKLIKNGGGTLVLKGTNTYSGNTVVEEGDLVVTSKSLPDAGTTFVNTAESLIFDQDFNGVHSGLISQNMNKIGHVIKRGSGQLTLSPPSANAYTGGTSIENGDVIVDHFSLQGDFSLDGSGSNTPGLIFDSETSPGPYAGIISDSGDTHGLTKRGASTLTLSGANTFEGPTIVEGASSELHLASALPGGAIASSSNVNVQEGGFLSINEDSIVKNLNGEGNVGVLSGKTLTAFHDQGETNTLEGILSGDGGLTKAGLGTMVLDNDATFKSAALVQTGKLVINGNVTMSPTITVDNGAELNFNPDENDVAIASVLTGAGQVTKTGSKSLTLNGATAGLMTAIDHKEGVLVVDEVSFVSTDITLDNSGGGNPSLVYDGGVGSYSGQVTSTGDAPSNSFTVTGLMADLVLTGENTFEGPTTIEGGTLKLANGAGNSLQNSSPVTVEDAGTLLIRVDNTVNNLVGDGVVFLDDMASINAFSSPNSTNTFEGYLTGSGALVKQGGGTMILTGEMNDWEGGTTVEEGTLVGNSDSLHGAIEVQSSNSLVFDQEQDGSYPFDITGTGAVVKEGPAQLTLSGINTYSGGTEILNGDLILNERSMQGDISLDGSDGNVPGLIFDGMMFGSTTYGAIITDTGETNGLSKRGLPSTLLLTGTNTYQGPTTVAEGTLRIDASGFGGVESGVIPFSKSVNVLIDGTLEIVDPNTINNLTGDGKVTLVAGQQTGLGVLIANSDPGMTNTFDGVISGDGQLVKLGAGTMILSGANSYSSPFGGASTIVTEGSLQVTAESIGMTGSTVFIGSNSNGLVVNQNDNNGIIGQNILGDGKVVKTGAAQLTLTGTNTYSGGTEILNGDLVLTNNSMQGPISTNVEASNVIYNSPSDHIYPTMTGGEMSGVGGLIKRGTSTLALESDNTYTGPTVIQSGRLTLASVAAISNSTSVQVQPNGELRVFAPTLVNHLNGSGLVTLEGDLTAFNNVDSVFDGRITGGGALIKEGLGNLVLLGQMNDYANTVINAGTLTGNSLSLEGDIENNAILNINQPFSGDDATITDVHGAGIVKKTGVADFIIDTPWTDHMGQTLVEEGTLVVGKTNPFASIVMSTETIVSKGAEIRGIGTVGPLTVFGTTHPGNSIGTINVVGTYTQSTGSILDVEINAAGNASKVDVDGNAVIENGATINVHPEPGLYVIGTNYVVVNTTGGVAGTYSNFNLFNPEELDGAELEAVYTPSQVLLNIVPLMITPERAAPAFGNSALAIQSAWVTDSVLSGKLDEYTCIDCCERPLNRFRPFLATDYNKTNISQTSTSLHGHASSWGLFGGADALITEDLLLGFAAGILEGHVHADRAWADNRNEAYALSLYAQNTWCEYDIALDGYLSGLWSEYRSTREDDGKMSGRTYGGMITGKVRFTYDYENCGFHLKPQAALMGNYYVVDGFTENGARRRIDFGRLTNQFLDGEISLAMSYAAEIAPCIYFWPEVKGGYQYDFLCDSAEIDAVMPEYLFTATHHNIRNANQHQGFVRGGFALGQSNGTKLSAYYEGVFGGSKFQTQASWNLNFTAAF